MVLTQTLSDNVQLEHIAGFFAPHKQRALQQIDEDMRIYNAYIVSGLSEIAFAKSAGVSRMQLRYIFEKYDLPKTAIDRKEVKQAARKLRRSKIIADVLANCDCYSCKVLRQVIDDEHKAVE